MSVEKLKGNIGEMEKILIELKRLRKNISHSDKDERQFYTKPYNSLLTRLHILNNTTPQILNEISALKKLDEGRQSTKSNSTESFTYTDSKNSQNYVTVNKQDREKLIKELSLSENFHHNFKRKKQEQEEKPSKLAKISNSIFGKMSEGIAKTSLQDLKKDLIDSNSRFLLSTYLSIAFFVSSCVFLGSLILLVLVGVFNTSYFSFFWLPFALLFMTLLFYYFSPSMNKGSIRKKIDQELPFATIYMAAIAGSNIEPTKIFKVIADNPEYKNFGFEVKKVVNQVEVYGYDLVTSLRNVAKKTTSEKLAELLEGMATNIVSGGSLKNYLDKKSENLLTDYRLEREKYNAVSATFMDIYISVLITAPLILITMLTVMSVTGFNLGFSTNILFYLSVVVIALINIIFLIFLQIKQPKT